MSVYTEELWKWLRGEEDQGLGHLLRSYIMYAVVEKQLPQLIGKITSKNNHLFD